MAGTVTGLILASLPRGWLITIVQGYGNGGSGFFHHDELRYIGAFWDRDPDLVRNSLGQIVVLKASAEAAGLDPDHWITYGSKTWVPAKGVDCNGVGFDLVGVPRECFLDNVFQKTPFSFGVRPNSAADYALERIMNEAGWDRFAGMFGTV